MMNSNQFEKKTKASVLNVLVFLYVLCVFTLNELPTLSSVDFFISIIIALVLFFKFFIDGSLHIPKLIWLPWIFFLFSISSVIWSYHPNVAFNTAFALFTTILSACIIWIALKNGTSMKAIIYSAAIASFIIVISTIYEKMQSTDPYLTRFSGILKNPNLLAIDLSLIGLLLLGLYTQKKPALLYGLFLIIFATIFSGSRKIIFTWMIVFIIFVLKSKFRIKKFTLVFSSFLFVLIFLAAIYLAPTMSMYFNNLSVVERFSSFLTGTDVSSADVRSDMIQEGFVFWQRHIWIGNGLGQFSELSIYKKYAHNNYIETLSGLGISGFLLYYSMYIYIFLKSIKLILRRKTTAVTSLSIIVLFLMWEVALVSYSEQVTWITLVLLFYLIAERTEVWTIKKI